MTQQKTIDIHTHILTEEMIRRMQQEAPSLAPKLQHLDDRSAIMAMYFSLHRAPPGLQRQADRV